MLVISCGVGCVGLSRDYVKADRATYKAIRPCVLLGIGAVGSATLDGRAYKKLLDSWDGRLTAAEAGQ